MRDKKSQTATEYLIILAVVIVISLIVIGVLGGIPSIGGGTSNSANDAKLKTSKIAIVSHSVTNEGTKVVVRNNQAETVKVRALDINGTVCSSSDLPVILPAGISKEILCTNIKSLIREDIFEFPLIINYTDTKTNSDYVLDDDLKLIGRVGHKSVVIWAESIISTVEINKSTVNGPNLNSANGYGSSIANLGDLDGDGVIDIAIGANSDATGVVHIHFMNSDGSIKSSVEINSSTINGPGLSNLDFYGNAVVNLGDLDGDGVTDIAVGAMSDDGDFVNNNLGAIYIHFLNSGGGVKSTVELSNGTANMPFLSYYGEYGSSIANLGDLDGDGVIDIAVGAWRVDYGGSAEGAVHIQFMNSDGSIKSIVNINGSTLNGPNLGSQDYYGSSITNLGDLDGDSVVDIAVGAKHDRGEITWEGAVHIHFLNSDGSVKSTSEINGSTLNGPNLGNFYYYGVSVSNLGDLNGDGTNDLAVGAEGNSMTYIHFLNSDGSVKSTFEINGLTLNGPDSANSLYYGSSISNLGDLNGDGMTDIAIGAKNANGTGVVHIHYLNSTLW